MSVTARPNPESDFLIAPPNFIERASSRIFRELIADAEDWAAMAGPLRLYPWTHFIENPRPEALSQHKSALAVMIAFGELLDRTTSSPGFPDKKTAAMVKATLVMLQDDLAMWHGNDLTEDQAEDLMQQVFPE